MPFELRDLGLVKLFFADALERDEALALLTAIKGRGQERGKTLQEIEPAGEQVADEGNIQPLLTLRMGIAVHQAMVDVCEEFEQRLTREAPRRLRQWRGSACACPPPMAHIRRQRTFDMLCRRLCASVF